MWLRKTKAQLAMMSSSPLPDEIQPFDFLYNGVGSLAEQLDSASRETCPGAQPAQLIVMNLF